jgi:hypothetical protein
MIYHDHHLLQSNLFVPRYCLYQHSDQLLLRLKDPILPKERPQQSALYPNQLRIMPLEEWYLTRHLRSTLTGCRGRCQECVAHCMNNFMYSRSGGMVDGCPGSDSEWSFYTNEGAAEGSSGSLARAPEAVDQVYVGWWVACTKAPRPSLKNNASLRARTGA